MSLGYMEFMVKDFLKLPEESPENLQARCTYTTGPNGLCKA